MTTITTSKANVRRMTPQQLRAQIDALVMESGLEREELQHLGESYQLDADGRGLLAEIEGLEWLLSRHS